MTIQEFCDYMASGTPVVIQMYYIDNCQSGVGTICQPTLPEGTYYGSSTILTI